MCSQAKHTHQQHQYGRSILNVVVQFASNPTQTEQPDHLQRAEQTADALETGRKTEMGISISQRLDSVLVSRQFCYRNEHAFTHQTPRAHSFHIKNANVEPDSNPGQLRTELCPWNKGIILFLFPSIVRCYIKEKQNTAQKHLPSRVNGKSVNIKMGKERDLMRCVQFKRISGQSGESFHLPAVT